MEDLIAAAGALVAAALTPGPNNFVVMRAAARGGLIRALPPIAGIVLGSLALLAVVAAGAGAAFEAEPRLEPALAIAGCLYLVYLGIRLLASGSGAPRPGRRTDMDNQTKRIVALAGSLRRNSFNRRLIEAAAELAPPGLEIRVYADLAAIPLFDEDLEEETGGGPEAVRQLRQEIAAADGLLLATPEYNQSIPGVLKNVLDWLSRAAPEEVLNNKPVAVIGATAGRWGTRLAQAALRQVLYATGSLVLPAPNLYAAGAERLFDPEGRLTDPATRRQLAAVLAAFAMWIERNRGSA